KVLQKPDKREVSDNIEATQRKSKRIDDGSRSEITFSDGLTCLSDFPVIRNIESSVSSTEETRDNLTAIPVTVETSPTQDDASESSKSYPKKSLFVNTKVNTKIPSQNAFNTVCDTDWNKFKVPELKAKCKELGLHVSGTKKVLIERILSYYHVDPNQTKNVEKVLQKPDKRE
ncbi:7865_t:CDS:2, partial [Racocetra persica]